MGHLVNPVAIRLGWIYSWENVYFCKFLYYPQLLHLLYKIKLYLLFYLRKSKFQIKLGILFSHLMIQQQGRYFYIMISSYQNVMESLIQDLILKNFWYIQKLIPNKREYYNTRITQKAVLFLMLYTFSFWSLDSELEILAIKIWPERLMTYLISSLNSNLTFEVIIYKLFFFKEISLKYKIRFLIFYKIFIKFIKTYNFSFWQGLSEIFYCYLNSFSLQQFFIYQSFYFKYGIQRLFQLNVMISWFRITNNEIKAEFLAYFLAYKFKQHFTVASLLKPIKHELQRLMYFLHNSEKNKLVKSLNHNLKNKYKLLLQKNYIYFSHCFYREWLLNFSLNKTWINFEYFIFLKNIHVKKLITKFKFKFCYQFFNNLALSLIINIPISLSFLKLLNNFNYFYLLKILLNFFYYDKTIAYLNIFNTYRKYMEALIFFNKYISYSWIEHQKELHILLQINKLQLRKKQITLQTWYGLAGCKLHFAGRFSRKQRASSIDIQYGQLPLNTIDSNIEYAMATRTIKNSSITVKVWFYYTNFMYSNAWKIGDTL